MSDVITELAMEASDKAMQIARLKAENAKLRELACRMLSSIKRFEMCSDSYSVSSVYEQWMRELGVAL